MKTQPIVPAQSHFDTDERAGGLALARAHEVYLRGNDLPARWAGRQRFVILETGFGLGHNFIAAWHAWRLDPARCRQLVFVSIEPQPPTRSDLERVLCQRVPPEDEPSDWPTLAAALVQAWPPLTPNLHSLDFEADRVRLMLAFGETRALLAELSLRADAFFLNRPRAAGVTESGASGTSEVSHAMKALGRRAAPDASLASPKVAAELHAGLCAAGFEIEHDSRIGDRHPITRARYRPRFKTTTAAPVPTERHAIVVGAGLAGAATADSLARACWRVTVLDRQPTPAAETSGNAGGIFHGTVHADDGPHARLLRAAALQAERTLRPLVASGVVPGQAAGLLRLDARPVEALQALIDRQSLPADWVQALDATQASARAGIELHTPAWFFPGGGWVSPAALVAHWLAGDEIRFAGSTAVHGLQRSGAGWQLTDNAGQVLAEAPVVVLTNAADAQRLLAPWHCVWPLQRLRGQVSGWDGGLMSLAPLAPLAPLTPLTPLAPSTPPAPFSPRVPFTPLALPLAGDGYALPQPGGGLLCGATSHISVDGDDDARVSVSEHEQNFLRLLRLTGLQPPPDPALWQGRVGWRLQTDDRLPLAGAVPQPQAPGRRDQARLWPRVQGLYVCTALGGRGITWAPLLGRLLTAQITGGPLPLEQGLVDAVDPARFQVRAARREAPA